VYGRDRPGAFELKMSLNDEHWAFMDRYQELLVARGPTLSGGDEGAVPTGSLHIVDLPDAQAARAFAFAEPYHRAGVFESVLLCRFHNVLGRTMWDFTEAVEGYGRFLVIAMDESDTAPVTSRHLIVYGELLALDGEARLGRRPWWRRPTGRRRGCCWERRRPQRRSIPGASAADRLSAESRAAQR